MEEKLPQFRTKEHLLCPHVVTCRIEMLSLGQTVLRGVHANYRAGV